MDERQRVNNFGNAYSSIQANLANDEVTRTHNAGVLSTRGNGLIADGHAPPGACTWSTWRATHQHTLTRPHLSNCVGAETWAKLFALIRDPSHAHRSLKLMLEDADVREAVDWDWETRGFGQTVKLLVQVTYPAGGVLQAFCACTVPCHVL